MPRIAALLCTLALAGCAASSNTKPAGAELASKPVPSATAPSAVAPGAAPMMLGNFSVSLAVKDIMKSLEFYEKLGFKRVAGNPAQKWVILQNETSTIGLHQGAFERNVLTYNPGWDRACNTLPRFVDVRDLQKAFMAKGLTPVTAADEASTGPANFMLIDPDGNPVLFDQHVPRPKP